ncbi:MAG: LexA family protein [bacterium]
MTESKKKYTVKEGQYLAFLYYDTKLHGRPPAEADLQRYFRVTPPTTHSMIVRLHRKGLIERELGKPRTIRNVLERKDLPDLV